MNDTPLLSSVNLDSVGRSAIKVSRQTTHEQNDFSHALKSASRDSHSAPHGARARRPDAAPHKNSETPAAHSSASQSHRNDTSTTNTQTADKAGDDTALTRHREASAASADTAVKDLTPKQRAKVQELLDKLSSVLKNGGSAEDLLAKLKSALNTAKLPASLTHWLTQQADLLSAKLQRSGADDETGQSAVAQLLASIEHLMQNHKSIQGQQPLAHKGFNASVGLNSHTLSEGAASQLLSAGNTSDKPKTDSGQIALSTLLDGKLDEGKLPSLTKLHGLLAGEKPHETADNKTSLTGLSALASAATTQTATAVKQPPAAANAIVPNFGQPSWGDAVGQKILWMARQNISGAELRLDPPDLGPMQVRVSVHNDQAQVSFTSHHPMVREALDQNTAKLRDMFAGQGLNLVDVDVSGQSQSDAQAQTGGTNQEGSGSGGFASGANAETESDSTLAEPSRLTRSVLSLVDHYA